MVILITGVSSGFGKAMATRLAKDGHKVYGTVRRHVPPIEGVTYLFADVLDDKAIHHAFNELMLKEKRIDVFINNAGMGIGGPLEFCSVADIQHQMDVNFMGMVRWLSHIIPTMRKQGFGQIICISSIAGRMGLPFQGAYSASKFAMTGYCEALRLELCQSGVRVILIEPGDFATSFSDNRCSVHSDVVAKAYPSYNQSMENVEQSESHGLKPSYLADKISKIVRKTNPHNRYVIATWLQSISVYAKRLLPEKVFFWILSKYFNLKGF
ncbi:MAG: SDR family oxidoreductase [Parabacteroides sp.]|nr:SDR family oxidoreductase [Parabacteroides sp.]